MRKTLYLLNIGGYAPDITALTYPLLAYYADKIGADMVTITRRRFPQWPITYEKLQIYELAQERGDAFSLYIDSDALIHPETPDWSIFLPRDTVAHNGSDMAAVRWRYDHYFRRDGRHFGSCNWYTMAWDWCIDLWRPLDDLTPAQAIDNIWPTVEELRTVITADHLVDDYALSRNIAKYGLKCTTLLQLLPKIGLPEANLSWHVYTEPLERKVQFMRETLETWRIPDAIRTYAHPPMPRVIHG